ncbi:tetratricopeptide repeat-containing sulfotransferase family protein [Glaciecola petra]|uniref:Sulfotransferase n=1 Tax=Glaciecola petra TaxID=3075602 RepID=A0ABU2ZL17_9ALTE|nr:sulfotransferase [Aestuariibacter sp. P117]MDT0593311.1 sulfotransferase [Aestuariibacter sp. P117]
MLEQVRKLIEIGDLPQAITSLHNWLKKEPRHYQAHLILSQCLFEQGLYKEALLVNQKAERFDPLIADFSLIQQHMQKQAFSEAKKVAKQMLLKQEAHPRAIFTLAHIAMASQQPEKSNHILAIGLQFSPANMMLRHMLMQSFESSGHYAKAIDEAKTLCAIEESFDTVWLYTSLLLKYGQNTELLNVCSQALHLAGTDKQKLAQVYLVLGQAYRIVGEREKCVDTYLKCIDIAPHNVDAWWGLADLKNYTFSPEDKGVLEALTNNVNLSQKARSVAFFVLAKIHESFNDWQSAMKIYSKANHSFPVANTRIKQTESEFALRKSTFTQAVLDLQADNLNQQVRPIFIIGLPRSGSTMIEQILASHSQIEGTLEQPTLGAIEKQANSLCLQKSNTNLFSAIHSLTSDELSTLGQAYLDKGALFRANRVNNENTHKRFFTDKQPFNFRHVGLIHKILPNAIIVDIRRNPLDCGLSLFKQYFLSGVDFSYNLTNIALFYNAYIDLMDFWDAQIPGRVLRIQYEELVKKPEFEIKRLLAHVGVEFEQDCVDFHKSKREVRTASSEQVRQAINSKGVGVWQNVEHELQELKSALGKKTLERYSKYTN